MRAGGVRGAIFAVFTPSEHEREQPSPRDDGVIEFAFASPVLQPQAAGYASAAAGRLLELERSGHLRIARTIGDVDAAADGAGPSAAVLHLEGAEAIDPDLEALAFWHAAGLRSLGRSGAAPTPSPTASGSSPPPRRTPGRV